MHFQRAPNHIEMHASLQCSEMCSLLEAPHHLPNVTIPCFRHIITVKGQWHVRYRYQWSHWLQQRWVSLTNAIQILVLTWNTSSTLPSMNGVLGRIGLQSSPPTPSSTCTRATSTRSVIFWRGALSHSMRWWVTFTPRPGEFFLTSVLCSILINYCSATASGTSQVPVAEIDIEDIEDI